MIKWEYEIDTQHYLGSYEINEYLSKRGSEGWELIDIPQSTTIGEFKRVPGGLVADRGLIFWWKRIVEDEVKQ